MVALYNREWTKQELLSHVGDIGQLGGIRMLTLADGPERGVRAAELRTAAGFRSIVYLDRGMDIGLAEYKGVPLSWLSPTGAVHPAFHEPRGAGWLRTFHGGLLTTCGLTQVGVPAEDRGEELGLHGRISHVPARKLSQGDQWDGDTYSFWLEGRMREVSVLGHDLELRRRIHARLDQPGLVIEDQVTNMGGEPAPHMMLYHINLGFPLLQSGSRLVAPSEEIVPRDEAAVQGVGDYAVFQPPVAGYAEQVFFHKLKAEQDGFVRVMLVNDDLHLGLQVGYEGEALPEFAQWKQMGWGTYVLGLEPGNCRPEGRVAARQRGVLSKLAPGETQTYHLELRVVAGSELNASKCASDGCA